MELHDFAEQVLFATTLEQKLRCPANITDDRPGSAIVAPPMPGRPRELHFKATGMGRDEFPGIHQLEQQRERGRLLHFFANHELLATELMALVLLRFPDAPAAFRKGVLQTLKDEQEHTRLYIQRMKECGIEFGELPVSGYFWRAVSGMENPMDYVAGLSLTFEQANLDFARQFASRFAALGDDKTAGLLEKIYRDEIGHVAYGLKWFRRWKNPDESDWTAFCRQLKFPLSPQRAKGFVLNVEGRRAAGLEPSFIAELEVYSRSKGRTPNVFFFNPFAEGHIAEGKAFNPKTHQSRLQRDLENLPQFLCRQDDVVLVKQKPSLEFLSGVKRAGFPLPEFVETESSGGVRELAQRKLGQLRPWAWGPDSVELLAPLFASLSADQRAAEACFNPGIAQLYSKAWSAEFFRKVLENYFQTGERINCGEPLTLRREGSRRPGEGTSGSQMVLRKHTGNWLCTKNEIGLAVNTFAEALDVISAIRKRGHHRIVIKQALGLAGGNAIRLFEPDLLESQRRWMSNALENRRQLVIEPWLERVEDFSVQLEMTLNGLKLCGYTGLLTDANGQFQGNWAAPQFERRPPASIVALFEKPPDIAKQLRAFYDSVFELLEKELRRFGFLGPVGIDAFVYRESNGECRLKPIVEINPRYTMGRVTVELMQRVAPGRFGLFRLITRKMAAAEGFDDFVPYAESLQKRFPLRLEGQPVARIHEGVLCLNEPATAQVVLATFQVSDDGSSLGVPR